MNARNRTLREWFDRIDSNQITLPRFQRFEAWGKREVAELLATVLRELPAGATLILEVGNEEQFASRTISEAPVTDERVTEQLLDGQQRLTALWRSLHDKYPGQTYLVTHKRDSDDDGLFPSVHCESRYEKKGQTKIYPLWVDDPQQCWDRGFIPARLLSPNGNQEERGKWIRATLSDERSDKYEEFQRRIQILADLQTRICVFNLPYLALPPTTPKHVALDVFIKTNTSSVKLSTYDIVVALVEEQTGISLHSHVRKLQDCVPRANAYTPDLPSLALDVVALRQNRTPNNAGYQSINYNRMVADWKALVNSIKQMVDFIEEERIFDSKRLPTYPALPVIAALWEHLPTQPDQMGNALNLIRRFLWCAFLTQRYEKNSTSHGLQDFRGLRKVLLDGCSQDIVPIFDTKLNELPSTGLILQASWPKRKTIHGRGLLALQIKCGAEDFAIGRPVTRETVSLREYHHLFPEALLRAADVPDERISLAVNCALIDRQTNRAISNGDPINYLRDRSENMPLGEDELRRRLKTHLIPYEALSVGYSGLDDADRRSRVQRDYETFLESRATILESAARQVCNGEPLDVNDLFEQNLKAADR